MTERPQIKFGTDGWRAIIADDFTFANVRACAEAVARNLVATGRSDQGLVVGFDTRFGSARFATAVAEVANGYGIATHTFDTAAPTVRSRMVKAVGQRQTSSELAGLHRDIQHWAIGVALRLSKRSAELRSSLAHDEGGQFISWTR